MSYRGQGGAPRVKKVMTQAINVIYEHLQKRDRVQIWLYENTSMRIEGIIIGFDEYMNIVLDEASEVNVKTQESTAIGRILLKGDCITLMQKANP
mmetsp:Transcript_3400/g.5318  ORF Transcript_3400/g.5318 Transcript_3400/m.5318 type:complete len:95 (+) Transcript_3400:47-331(+)|eukprot:CAMPEP_0185022726 /NCGR_PEP_ID=MMETSP1103-20130426/5432_1 /TAXON_ID=36769 /ORGANISM="Paraphysomonas bandaiensis, Strain Caron Lab Isolate" /LENGTH=94 /DNA_ID=CAMNT_0027554939 /DNA_START=50 /DNA_END=334 /DNA_ORIENTATION=+